MSRYDVLAALHTVLCHPVDPGSTCHLGFVDVDTCQRAVSVKSSFHPFHTSVPPAGCLPFLLLYSMIAKLESKQLTYSRHANLGAPRENEPNACRVTLSKIVQDINLDMMNSMARKTL
jgi:hypothetical protein